MQQREPEEGMLRPIADTAVESLVQCASGGTLFVAHGSPTLPQGAIPVHKFLVKLGQMLPRPKAILCISAHWQTSEPCLTGTRKPDTLTESVGMMSPAQTKYDCPGDPILARRAAECLRVAGMKVTLNNTRGIDQAVWDPLRCMAPAADVPVVELSVQPAKSVAHHYEVGQALVPLTREGYLVIGSGLAVHNLKFASADARSGEGTPVWAQAFDDWLRSTLLEGRYEDVVDYRSKGPFANLAHPTSEEMLPLIVALGAAGPQSKAHAINTGFGFSSISQACFYFQCHASEFEWTAQATEVNTSLLVPGSGSKRIPIQRSKTRIKTLAGSRPTQMVVSEAHLEALQRCVLEQSQPEESNAYKSPLAERLETAIAATKRAPNADSFSRNVSLNRKLSGFGDRKRTPQQHLRESIRAQRASVEEVLKRGLAASSRKRGGIMPLSKTPCWEMTSLGSASRQKPQSQTLEQSASSHQLSMAEATAQSTSAHKFGVPTLAEASSKPLPSFANCYGHFNPGRMRVASQPSDLAKSDDQRGCCFTCRSSGVPFPSQAQTPSLEKAFSEFGMVPNEAPIADKRAHGSGVHRALKELFGEPQNVIVQASHSSKPRAGDQEPVLERLLSYPEDSLKGWQSTAKHFSLQHLPTQPVGLSPQATQEAVDRSQMQGLGPFNLALLGDNFERRVMPGDAEILASAQPQNLPRAQELMLLGSSDHGAFHPVHAQESAPVSKDGLDKVFFSNELALEGSEPLDRATFAQEAAAIAMLGGVSQPDWLWAADSEMVSQQDDVMESDTWGSDVILPATAAQERAADAMLAGMSQPDWLWANSDAL